MPSLLQPCLCRLPGAGASWPLHSTRYSRYYFGLSSRHRSVNGREPRWSRGLPAPPHAHSAALIDPVPVPYPRTGEHPQRSGSAVLLRGPRCPQVTQSPLAEAVAPGKGIAGGWKEPLESVLVEVKGCTLPLSAWAQSQAQVLMAAASKEGRVNGGGLGALCCLGLQQPRCEPYGPC